ncbi:MAG TPA: DUF1059 domain-containing protein [Chitinophagaceae bacterium]|jgi:predicted small metal-binding protein|nr:DUF1059 domain-containing protein [Chitinophagaceae bacterium]
MKILHCSDAGFNCEAVVKGETEDEIINQAAEHTRTVHNVELTPEMADEVKKLIKDEETA